jgi:hypothetical protein
MQGTFGQSLVKIDKTVSEISKEGPKRGPKMINYFNISKSSCEPAMPED